MISLSVIIELANIWIVYLNKMQIFDGNINQGNTQVTTKPFDFWKLIFIRQ